ncbi:MAG: hypothetical protein V2A74_12955, partial [bacterium]
ILSLFIDVTPGGNVLGFTPDLAKGLCMLLVLPLMAAILAIPVCLVGLAFKPLRQLSLFLIIPAVLFVGTFFISARIGNVMRIQAFQKLAERSQPLVEAIDRYDKDHSQPPQTLKDLVPQYLPEIPKTGMAGYPEFEYYAGAKAKNYHDNPWVLVVPTPLGFLNWDNFMYFPKQNYPEEGYGGVLERVGDWAYVHE